MTDIIVNTATKIILQTLTKQDLVQISNGYFKIKHDLSSFEVTNTLSSFSIWISNEETFENRRYFFIRYPNRDYYKIELTDRITYEYTLEFNPYEKSI